MSEDDFIYWQDVLDDVAAGRTGALRCPFCQKEGLKIGPAGTGIRIECPACRHFIEGRFPTVTNEGGSDGGG